MPVMDVNAARVHVEDTGVPPGRPDAEAVVFGHGLLFSGRSFDGQVERLRDQYRCVTIDWRGQGRSPAAASGYDMDTLTQDTIGVIDALGLGPVHFVGLSMGGFVGMRLAARHPQHLRTLTLIDTSAEPEDAANVGKYRLLARIYRLFGIRPVRSRVEHIMFSKTNLADPDFRSAVDAWVAEMAKLDRSGVKKAIYGVIDRDPILAEIDRITVPALVIVGADDVATPLVKSERIVAAISGSRLEVVPDAGHSSSIEQPVVVAALIEEFIEAPPSSA
jgi:3-oxoadipate enol-lactonase